MPGGYRRGRLDRPLKRAAVDGSQRRVSQGQGQALRLPLPTLVQGHIGAAKCQAHPVRFGLAVAHQVEDQGWFSCGSPIRR